MKVQQANYFTADTVKFAMINILQDKSHRLNHSATDGKKSASTCIRSSAHHYNLQLLLHCLQRLYTSTHLALPLNCIKA